MTPRTSSVTDPPEADVFFEDHGTIVALTGMTKAGRDWIEANCPHEPWQRMGASLMIEARYAPEILAGIEDDGFTIGR